ncbi:MAG: hypothetical protein U5K84_07345 [Alkalibacterium sp.]|nr:hypothetical protein [Alkalibacterium sp.]
MSVYEKTGSYQLYLDHIGEPEGLGQLYAAYDKQKKLTEAGWSDADLKKPLNGSLPRMGSSPVASGASFRH